MPWLQSQIAGSERALAVVPERLHPDAALLSIARDDPVGSRTAGTRTSARTTTVHRFDESQTIADVAARRRLLHRADRQVPQPVSVRARTVHPARDGTVGSSSATRPRPRRTRTSVSSTRGSPCRRAMRPPRTPPTCSPTTPSTSCGPRRTTGRSSCTSRRARRTRRGPRRSGTSARSQTCAMPVSPSVDERNVSDKPAWVRKAPPGRRVGASRAARGSAARGGDAPRRGRRRRADRRAARERAASWNTR